MNQYTTVFEWCRDHAAALRAAAERHTYGARTIIALHDMYVRHADRLALTLLACAVAEYQSREVSQS